MASKEIKLVFYIVMIYVCFVYWGYIQEKLVSNEYILMSEFADASEPLAPTARWDMSLVLNCSMAVMCTMVCLLIEQFYYGFTGERNVQPDPTVFLPLSLTCVVASPLSYEALKYISFPLMVLAKSSKPIPVMLIGVLQFGKSYSVVKYVSVMLLVVGIGLFSYATKKPGSQDASAANPLLLQIYGETIGFIRSLTVLWCDGRFNDSY